MLSITTEALSEPAAIETNTYLITTEGASAAISLQMQKDRVVGGAIAVSAEPNTFATPITLDDGIGAFAQASVNPFTEEQLSEVEQPNSEVSEASMPQIQSASPNAIRIGTGEN